MEKKAFFNMNFLNLYSAQQRIFKKYTKLPQKICTVKIFVTGRPKFGAVVASTIRWRKLQELKLRLNITSNVGSMLYQFIVAATGAPRISTTDYKIFNNVLSFYFLI